MSLLILGTAQPQESRGAHRPSARPASACRRSLGLSRCSRNRGDRGRHSKKMPVSKRSAWRGRSSNGCLRRIAVWSFPALDGEPGVDSALYAGTHGDDRANNQKLLAKLASLPDDRCSAYYICVAVLSDPSGEVMAVTEGRCHGVITDAPRGSSGFGYDPLFLVLRVSQNIR